MTSSNSAQLDYLGIFREFAKQKINYVICGGIAVNLRGIPRMTYDIDLLLDMENGNIRRFLNLLKNWGFKPKVPVDIMDFADEKKRREWITRKRMKAFNFYNDKWAISEIDVLLDSPVTYRAAAAKADIIDLKGVKLPVMSIADLIKMKQNTGRKQDDADIFHLKRLS